MSNAGGVSNNQRHAGPGLSLGEGLHGLNVVGSNGHLSHVHVAVAAGFGAEIFLRCGLTTRGELGDRGTWSRLRRLPASVRVHLCVEHEDVHVAARAKHMVETARTNVIGPTVAADNPHVLTNERTGEWAQPARQPRHRKVWGCGQSVEKSIEFGHQGSLTGHARIIDWLGRINRKDAIDQRGANLRRQLPQPLLSHVALAIERDSHTEAKLGVVLEQRVRPSGAATLCISAPRSGGQVAAEDG